MSMFFGYCIVSHIKVNEAISIAARQHKEEQLYFLLPDFSVGAMQYATHEPVSLRTDMDTIHMSKYDIQCLSERS